MTEVGRSAIVVTPTQPFLDWLQSVDPTSMELTLADLGIEPTIYLIPECETPEDVADCLRGIRRDLSEPVGRLVSSTRNVANESKL
jgi:hypothetical protein